jgi:hypothetical protein
MKTAAALGMAALLILLAVAVLAVIHAFGKPKANVSGTGSTGSTATPGTADLADTTPEAPLAASLGTGFQGIIFPPDSGVINVTLPPYGARGDGQTDDTVAIQQALADCPDQQAIIYLPNGTYLLSGTLRWGKGDRVNSLCKRTTLQGQSREGTILKLKNACPGFDDPAQPQALIWTGPQPAERRRNSVRNLTVDTGSGNPGAIGVQFNANYVGCVRDVLIRSGDGQGVTGLDMAFVEEIGPLLIKNLTVRGFDVGIQGRGGFSSQTFEHITLEDQNQVAFINDAEAVSIRDLSTRGRGPAFWSKNWVGLAVIIDAKCSGLEGAESYPAIANRPGLFVRNLAVSGFAHAIAHIGVGAETNVPGPLVQEWSSSQFSGSKPSLSLPVKETADVPWDDPAQWVNPVSFGADPRGRTDSSDAIQQAIDSGQRTVYLPRGDYLIRQPVVLGGRVRRLIGCEASLQADPSLAGQAVITVGEGESPVVVIERIEGGFRDGRSHPGFLSHASKRTLVLRDCLGFDADFSGPGEVFLENVAGKFLVRGKKVWARQVHVGTSHRTPPDRWWHLRNEGGAR